MCTGGSILIRYMEAELDMNYDTDMFRAVVAVRARKVTIY
jgi:hypothetical protein